jgi:predicted ABC-type ATPase
MLRRTTPMYSEQNYTGAEYAPGYAAAGNGREASPLGLVRQARTALRDNGVVFAVQSVRQALFAEARFIFQSMADDHTFGDQSLSLLEHPWPGADSGELLARLCQAGSLGNGYFRKAIPAGSGNPVLVELRQENVTILSQELEDDLGRTWKQPVGYLEDMGPGREPQIYTTDEVGHFSPTPDPFARWRGMSWLTPILSDVRTDQQLTRYKTFHLENGAMPGLVVKYSTKLTTKTVDTLRRRLKARYGGADNAGNVLVLDEGADMSVAGSTLEQLQADAVTKAGERRVCGAGGPGMLVICGFEQGDYTSSIRQLADLWARPWWRMACASLEHLVPTSSNISDVRLWYNVGGIAALREGELARGQAFLVNVQGIASAVAAGYSRETSVAAAAANDVAVLVADPKAPPPGTSSRQTATEQLGPNGTVLPPKGGPAGNGAIAGRPPQAGLPQQLSMGKPNLPNALPPGAARPPQVPLGPPRGAQPSRRSEDMEAPEMTRSDHPLSGNAADSEAILVYLQTIRDPAAPDLDGPPDSAVRPGWLAADNEIAWTVVRDDPRWRRLGLSELDARLITQQLDPGPRSVARSRWLSRFDPSERRDFHGRWGKGGATALPAGGAPKLAAAPAAGHGIGQFGVPDSLAAHTLPGGQLSPARQALHDQIVADTLKGMHPSRGPKPVATFLGGGPASGKSTLGAVPSGSVAVDPDAIKGKLPEYQAMVSAGDPKAAMFAHEESSKIAKDVQRESVKHRLDFTLDGTGDTSFAKMSAKIDAAQKAGYQIDAKYVTVDTDEAIRRAQARAARTGRMVPESVIREIHASVSATFAKLIESGKLDTAELWDNNGSGKPSLVGRKKLGGDWVIADEGAWRRFLAKAK